MDQPLTPTPTPTPALTLPIREAIDAFAVDFALLLAGWVTYGPEDIEPYDPTQIATAASAAIGAFARTHPEYEANHSMDITQAVQLTVHTYAESMKANLVAQLQEIESLEQASQEHGHVSELEAEAMREMLDHDPSALGTADELAFQQDVEDARTTGAVAPR